MNELYWITRLDYIHNIFIALLIISSCVLVSLIMIYISLRMQDKPDDEECKRSKKYLVILSVIVLASVSILSFVPSTKEYLLIYGAGGTIDYIKSNDTAKKIPDKVIDSLDKLLDEYLKDK